MPLPQPLQLPPAHGSFLGHPIETLGKDMEFAVLGQQFDLNALAGLLPRLVQQGLFQTVQASRGVPTVSCGSAVARQAPVHCSTNP